FLQEHSLPTPQSVRRIDFRTASPSVSARVHWATIEEQIHPFAPSAVHLAVDSARLRFHGTTENVGRLTLDVGRALSGQKSDGPIAIELDGQTIANPAVSTASDGERVIWLARSSDLWSCLHSPIPPSRKSPLRQGPFKEAFRNRFLFVIGTSGTPQENAW